MDWTFVSFKVESQFVNPLPIYPKFGVPLFCLNLLNFKTCLSLFVPTSSPSNPCLIVFATFDCLPALAVLTKAHALMLVFVLVPPFLTAPLT